jgi:hypothetical protein
MLKCLNKTEHCIIDLNKTDYMIGRGVDGRKTLKEIT